MSRIERIIGLIAIVCTMVQSIAQTQTDSQQRLDEFTKTKRHEVSIDVISGLALPAINPRYEYVLGRYSGVGVDLFIALDNEDLDFENYEKFSLTPFYRQYFFSKEDFGAKGFYGEGFIKFFTYDNLQDTFDSNGNFIGEGSENQFETAIGVSIGWKWVSNSGFFIDTGFGIGRELGFSDDDTNDLNGIRVRGGVNFGFRF